MMRKYIYKFEAMSTYCEVILYSLSKTLADEVAKAILSETKRLEKKYNYYSSDSYLSQINSRQESLLDQESKNLLSRAKKYYKLTNGVFDISVATLKDLYRDSLSTQELEAKRSFLLPYVGCEHFMIKRNKIVFDNEYTKLDLGGFVKEYAVDRAVSILKKHKISSALVNYGGDIYAVGKKPDNSQFKLGIKNPSNPKEFVKELFLEDQALTTSASYERNYKIGDEVYSHIINKKRGNSSYKSVSVISQSCVESGVYSTSLMIDESLEIRGEKICIK
jgi:thiamine biosynthesis lipoprotein